jgi:predicted DNA-binding transcriptional regulator AlpA
VKEYDFTLKFELSSPRLDGSLYIDQLYEGGCDDALIGVGKPGCLALNFIRASETAQTAIDSAKSDVEAVIPQATLIEASPDLVSLTEVAKLLGCSRQNIRKLVFDSASPSPRPLYNGHIMIWHLADILSWLKQHKNYDINEELLEVAEATMKLNISQEWHRITQDNALAVPA